MRIYIQYENNLLKGYFKRYFEENKFKGRKN